MLDSDLAGAAVGMDVTRFQAGDVDVTLSSAAPGPSRRPALKENATSERDVTTTAPRQVLTTPREENDMTLTDRTTATGHAIRGEWGRSNRHWEEA